MSLSNWPQGNNRKYEDGLLLKYWQTVGGLIYTEVIVGRGGIHAWPKGAKPRMIDGVRIISSSIPFPPDIITFNRISNLRKFKEMLAGAEVEVIEIKRCLNRPVIGQVIVGADLIKIEYTPAHIKQVVICGFGDPVLETVCKNRDIKVWIPPE